MYLTELPKVAFAIWGPSRDSVSAFLFALNNTYLIDTYYYVILQTPWKIWQGYNTFPQEAQRPVNQNPEIYI